jgi:hypothetical protein
MRNQTGVSFVLDFRFCYSTKTERIVVDPLIAGGRPFVAGTGTNIPLLRLVRLDNRDDMFFKGSKGGDKSPHSKEVAANPLGLL